MRLWTQEHEDFVQLCLQGEFDTPGCPDFLDEIDRLLRARRQRIALNLERATFLSSSAIGAIIEASRRLRDRGGRLVISGSSSFHGEVLRKIGLARLVPIFGSEREARLELLGGVPACAARELEGQGKRRRRRRLLPQLFRD